MRARCGRMNSPLVLNTRSTGAEVAGEQKTFSKSACKTLKCWVSPDYGPQFFRFVFAVHRCKTIQLDISHATLAPTQSSEIFEDLNFRGREQGQGLENWSSRILEDKDFSRGQQHWISMPSSLWAALRSLAIVSAEATSFKLDIICSASEHVAKSSKKAHISLRHCTARLICSRESVSQHQSCPGPVH